MSDLDDTTEFWVLRAKVEGYEKALAECMKENRALQEESIVNAETLHRTYEGVRGFALTLRKWAVAAGGHTPSAIIASRMLEMIGDESEPDKSPAHPESWLDCPDCRARSKSGANPPRCERFVGVQGES